MELAGFVGIGAMLRSGVYALVWREKVVYIGKSKAMLGRIYTHKTQVGRRRLPWSQVGGIRFDDVFICPCPIEKLADLEKDMINLYKPKYNTRLKTPDMITQELVLKHMGYEIVLNRPKAPPVPTVIVGRRL